MCRNIKTLFNFDPPVTPEEVRAASLQFVRKITGFNKPSKANEAAFDGAVEEIAKISARLSAIARNDCNHRKIARKKPPKPEPGRPFDSVHRRDVYFARVAFQSPVLPRPLIVPDMESPSTVPV